MHDQTKIRHNLHLQKRAARTTNGYPQTNTAMASMKRVLIYCRESRDEGFENIERIETQRDILTLYCARHKLGRVVGIVMDDNKTGTDFERLSPIKARIAHGEIDIFLAKDASRLGRNVLESLRFTAFLEAHGVELVFESEAYNEELFPLIAWFNERRARDDSQKIRRVLRHKMERGELVIKAPYGYRKVQNRLVVDEPASLAVREIFALFIQGHSQTETAARLQSTGLPSPSGGAWNAQHIGRILRHPAYTGDMPYGMRRKVSFKSKKYERIPAKDWLIVPGHHTPIVCKEIFAAAQARLCAKPPAPRNPGQNLFSGLLFCGGCGKRMYRKTRAGKSAWYVCGQYDREGTAACQSHRVMEAALTEAASSFLAKLLADPRATKALQAPPPSEEAARRAALNAEKAVLQSKAAQVYQDKLDGRLPPFLLEEALQDITARLQRIDQALALQAHMPNEADAVPAAPNLTHGLLRALFQDIQVYAANELTPRAAADYELTEAEACCLQSDGGVLFVMASPFHASHSPVCGTAPSSL